VLPKKVRKRRPVQQGGGHDVSQDSITGFMAVRLKWI